MKKLEIWNKMFLVVIIVTTLVACDNKPKHLQPVNADKAKQDSIARIKAAEERARLAFEDSVAIYAWGDAKFGMSKKEVLKTTAFSGSQKYEYGLAMNSDKEFALQRSLHLFGFSKHMGLFRWRELRRVDGYKYKSKYRMGAL